MKNNTVSSYTHTTQSGIQAKEFKAQNLLIYVI